jgi:hypothetical protein
MFSEIISLPFTINLQKRVALLLSIIVPNSASVFSRYNQKYDRWMGPRREFSRCALQIDPAHDAPILLPKKVTVVRAEFEVILFIIHRV